jgi:hypothetical protein
MHGNMNVKCYIRTHKMLGLNINSERFLQESYVLAGRPVSCGYLGWPLDKEHFFCDIQPWILFLKPSYCSWLRYGADVRPWHSSDRLLVTHRRCLSCRYAPIKWQHHQSHLQIHFHSTFITTRYMFRSGRAFITLLQRVLTPRLSSAIKSTSFLVIFLHQSLMIDLSCRNM